MPPTAGQAALEALAAALDPRDFATTLTTTPGQPATLAVTSRHAALGDDIRIADGWFWWSWAERITPASDVPSAAAMIARVLSAAPQPARG